MLCLSCMRRIVCLRDTVSSNTRFVWHCVNKQPMHITQVAEEVEAQLQSYKRAVDEINARTGGVAGGRDGVQEDHEEVLRRNTATLMSAVSSLPELQVCSYITAAACASMCHCCCLYVPLCCAFYERTFWPLHTPATCITCCVTITCHILLHHSSVFPPRPLIFWGHFALLLAGAQAGAGQAHQPCNCVAARD